MPYIDEYKPEERIFALHISRSGDGKSAAAASYPHPYHQLDYDGRFDGVKGALKPPYGFGFIDVKNPKDVSYTRLYTRKGYDPTNDLLTKWENEYISTGRFPYATIEIASITNMIQCLINSSHDLQKGKKIGSLRISGPGDFAFEVSGLKQFLDWILTFPCHVVCSAHLIGKWGKPKGAGEYAQNEVIREKLSLRDQPGENILTCFSNIFKFSREEVNGEMKYYVEFATDIAKNAFNIPPGRFDITGKPFYPYLQNLIRSIKDGTFERPKFENKSIFG